MDTHAQQFASLLEQLPPHLAERTRLLPGQSFDPRRKRVVYWTHHALRSDENPALDVAIFMAQRLGLPLLVYQGLSEKYQYASDRHHTFILEAARDLQQSYAKLGINFALHVERRGARSPHLARLATTSAVIVTDDFPIEATKVWADRIAQSTTVLAVDTACIVPMKMVGKSHERAFAFRDATAKLRNSRIDRPWPSIAAAVETEDQLPFESVQLDGRSLAELVAQCDIDHSIGPVSDTRGGSIAGYARWQSFRKSGLRGYAKRRNQIEIDGVSRMSAYLHYGMVSPFRIAREASADRAEKYLDELLIWRELAYCFCFYRTNLDYENSIPGWARSTLSDHQRDKRDIKSWETLARAQTGSRLWDAAQRSLLKHGELHNNVRMTWGKAILEWSADGQQSLERLVDLNHRYALDGRDPSSYGGILWCLGQFDRPFSPEQPVLGTVRPREVAVHEDRTDMVAYEARVDRNLVDPSPQIAIIGAGLGGLICGRILQDHGLSVKIFDKSDRVGGRISTRRSGERMQFDHGAQYFRCHDSNLQRHLESWVTDRHIAKWNGKIVTFDEAGRYKASDSLDRYVGTPRMESLADHLSEDLTVRFDTEVGKVVQDGNAYLVTDSAGASLGQFDMVLWNCPPIQTARQMSTPCDWQDRLSEIEMLPCWAVMFASETKWEVPFDGAFINQGSLSWISRDSSKPGRASGYDSWVLHSSPQWAKEHLETSKDDVIAMLISEAEKITASVIPERCFQRAHRWLYSRPAQALQDLALWDDQRWLGACGDWCGGPRVEGALKSGIALAGRVLGSLHERSATTTVAGQSQQLSLFKGIEA
jgi:photolyase PhrII